MKKLAANFKPVSALRFLLFCCSTLSMLNSAKAQPTLFFNPLIQNLTAPVEVRNAGDSSGRLFIVEKGGKVKIYKNGSLLSKPFLDISNLVKTGTNDGLYTIAFAPNYKINRTFFVYYIAKNTIATVARYQTSKTNPDSAIASSGVTLLAVPGKNTGGAHTGDMHFGSDNYLYLTFNDGSFYSSTTAYAQDGQSLLGKMLRINVLNVNTAPYYTIPPDNPFVNDANVLDEIWALGLRNGWRWSFDRSTGDLWIGDVGGDNWEEVNYRTPAQSAGSNYGWPCYEGNDTFHTAGCGSIGNYVFPIVKYQHISATSAEVITGGYVYRGTAFPLLSGYYVCADYTTGTAFEIKANGSGVWKVKMQKNVPVGIVGFGEGEDGELYAASLSDGKVYHVQTTAPVVATSKNIAVF